MTTMNLISAWRARRLQAKHVHHLHAADYYRSEARRLALLAYEVPDMMAEPLKWGRLQNGANWANYHERQHREEARRIERLITEAAAEATP